MGKTIGVISIKGGVGKTTVSAALASNLANEHRKKVLLVDTNYSAPNLGMHMGIIDSDKTVHHALSGHLKLQSTIHKNFNVDVVPGSYLFNKDVNYSRFKDKLNEIKKDYDFIVLDSSPSLNEEILSTIMASDHLFLVSTPDHPTMTCSIKVAKMAQKRGKNVSGIIVNKVRDPKFELSLNEIEDAIGVPVVAKMGDDKEVLRALFNGVPISEYNKDSKFAKEISRLSHALTDRDEKVSWYEGLFSGGIGKEKVNRQMFRQDFYKSQFG